MDRVVNKGIDYTDKSAWSESNLPQIAADLGYVLNGKFTEALNKFILTTVNDARITEFLLIVAQNHFKTVKPPLETVNNGH